MPEQAPKFNFFVSKYSIFDDCFDTQEHYPVITIPYLKLVS